MAENISSNVLFHFTDSMDRLKSILRHGFSPHFCPEFTLDPADVEAANSKRPPMRAAPMVCFCDLPLSLIHKHLKEYGNFGIGLDKDWGLENGIAPVIYTYARAQTHPAIMQLITKASEIKDRIMAINLNLLAAYTKPFVGPAWRHNRVEPSVRFYDEREWRYIPSVREGEAIFLKRNDYDKGSKAKQSNKRFKPLLVTPKAIQYLIVAGDEDENDVLELHDYIMKLYVRRFSRKDAVLVGTTIMTVDRIQED